MRLPFLRRLDRYVFAEIIGPLALGFLVYTFILMSLLFAILIAIGRLASDSELIAMRSCGVSLVSLYRPILLVSAALTVVNLYLMLHLLPRGNTAVEALKLQILTRDITQLVEP